MNLKNSRVGSVLKSMAIYFMDSGYPIDLLEKATLNRGFQVQRWVNRHDLLHPAWSDPKTKNDRSILVTT